jgi:fumarate reductase subunit C
MQTPPYRGRFYMEIAMIKGKSLSPFSLLVLILICFLLVVKPNYSFLQIFHFLKRNPAVIFLTVTSVLAYLSWRSQRHLTRAKHTMDFQVSFSDSETMKKAAKTFHTLLCNMSTDELVRLSVSRKPSKQHERVVQILNAWERVAVALKHDVYDEEMLYDIYGTFLLKLCSTLSPFINHRQELNPKVFVNLSWLYVKWRARRCGSEDKIEKAKVKAELKQRVRNLKL